mgnify:CR=1 FL=1
MQKRKKTATQGGVRAEKHWKEAMEKAQSKRLAELTSESFRLTKKGLRFADAVGSDFVHIAP